MTFDLNRLLIDGNIVDGTISLSVGGAGSLSGGQLSNNVIRNVSAGLNAFNAIVLLATAAATTDGYKVINNVVETVGGGDAIKFSNFNAAPGTALLTNLEVGGNRCDSFGIDIFSGDTVAGTTPLGIVDVHDNIALTSIAVGTNAGAATKINNNTAGSIISNGGASTKINNNTVDSIVLGVSTGTVDDSTINNNNVAAAAGITIFGTTLSQITVVGNTLDAGLISFTNGPATVAASITGCTICSNSVHSSAITFTVPVVAAPSVTLTGCTIGDNRVGGTILIDGDCSASAISSNTIGALSITGNTATTTVSGNSCSGALATATSSNTNVVTGNLAIAGYGTGVGIGWTSSLFPTAYPNDVLDTAVAPIVAGIGMNRV